MKLRVIPLIFPVPRYLQVQLVLPVTEHMILHSHKPACLGYGVTSFSHPFLSLWFFPISYSTAVLWPHNCTTAYLNHMSAPSEIFVTLQHLHKCDQKKIEEPHKTSMVFFYLSFIITCIYEIYFARFTNFVNSGCHNRFTVPIGPLRCLAMITSAMFGVSVSLL